MFWGIFESCYALIKGAFAFAYKIFLTSTFSTKDKVLAVLTFVIVFLVLGVLHLEKKWSRIILVVLLLFFAKDAHNYSFTFEGPFCYLWRYGLVASAFVVAFLPAIRKKLAERANFILLLSLTLKIIASFPDLVKKHSWIEGFVTSLEEQLRYLEEYMHPVRLERHSATIHEVVERQTEQAVENRKLEAEHRNQEAELRKLEAEHRNQEAELRKLKAELCKLEADYRNQETEHRNQETEHRNQEAEHRRKLEAEFREEIRKLREEYDEPREGWLRQREGSIRQREKEKALRQQVDAQPIQLSELREGPEPPDTELRERKSKNRALQESEAKIRELQEALVKAQEQEASVKAQEQEALVKVQDELQECKAELDEIKNKKSFLRRAGSRLKHGNTTATDAASTNS